MSVPTSPTQAPVLVHVGLHKTGTTWLQAGFFRRPEAGFHDIVARLGTAAVLDILVRVPDLGFDATVARDFFAEEIANASTRSLVPVISHERLSGYPPGGSIDRTIVARRIAHVFDSPRILLVISEQNSLIHSLYGQYVADGGHLSLRRFLRGTVPALARKHEFRLHVFEYDALINFYYELFGRANVLALTFEHMRSDPVGFAERVAKFAGVPERQHISDVTTKQNRRRPIAMQGVRRYANSLLTQTELNDKAIMRFHSLDRVFWRAGPYFRRLTPTWLDDNLADRQRQQIASFVDTAFAESNKRTESMLEIDLATLGYRV